MVRLQLFLVNVAFSDKTNSNVKPISASGSSWAGAVTQALSVSNAGLILDVSHAVLTFLPSGEGYASLCLEWGCGCRSAMDCCKSCTPRGWVAPCQTGSLQWQLPVTGAGMAGNDSGIGSGWQQSKQN